MHPPKIPVYDPAPEIEELWSEMNAAIQGVLRSGHFIMGPNVKAFEDEIARYLGVRHAVGLNSGTDALVIGLRALGVGAGDEVITTPFTFFATAEAVSAVGATPVFVDIDRESYNLDVSLVERAITPRTKVIIPVHLYGLSAEMAPLLDLARARGLKVLEDVAQAMGGTYDGRALGTLGDVGAYSFFPTKNLGAYGDGGLLTTESDEVADTARMLRTHGSRKKYFNEAVGYNSRLDEMQAAILRVKLPRLAEQNRARREAAERYRALLGSDDRIALPRDGPRSPHVYHQYTVQLRGVDRDRVQQRLADAGVATMIYYPNPLHRLPMYAGSATCPNADAAAREVLSLPMGPSITKETQERVAHELVRALALT